MNYFDIFFLARRASLLFFLFALKFAWLEVVAFLTLLVEAFRCFCDLETARGLV